MTCCVRYTARSTCVLVKLQLGRVSRSQTLIVWHGGRVINQYTLERGLENLGTIHATCCNINNKDELSTFFLWLHVAVKELMKNCIYILRAYFIHSKEDLLKGHVEMRIGKSKAKHYSHFIYNKTNIIYIYNSQNNAESGGPNTNHHFRQYLDLCIHHREQAKCHPGGFSPNNPSTPVM